MAWDRANTSGWHGWAGQMSMTLAKDTKCKWDNPWKWSQRWETASSQVHIEDINVTAAILLFKQQHLTHMYNNQCGMSHTYTRTSVVSHTHVQEPAWHLTQKLLHQLLNPVDRLLPNLLKTIFFFFNIIFTFMKFHQTQFSNWQNGYNAASLQHLTQSCYLNQHE